MKHLGLFEGIGGFSLAARWMGWETVAWVEIDKFCQQVLKKNFPEAKGYGDIKEFDGTKYAGHIDILTGGFPCQPFSTAGNRKGTEDDRYLWPEMLRVISEVQPRWVVGENVSGFATMDIDTQVHEVEDQESSFVWFKKVAQEVVDGLNSIGYDVPRTNKGEPIFFSFPACGVDAPHQRDRIWIIAYPKSDNDRRAEREFYQTNGRQVDELLSSLTSSSPRLCKDRLTANSSGHLLQRRPLRYEPAEGAQSLYEQPSGRDQFHGQNWQVFPTQSPVCRGDDGIPNRVDRIKSLGNAIVPQVAYEIFKAIEGCRKVP
jgi:DNA (cytosine-5)-methyltransferase 1